jgi:hypothetical protein
MRARKTALARIAMQQNRIAQRFEIGPLLPKKPNISGRYKMLLMKMTKPLR